MVLALGVVEGVEWAMRFGDTILPEDNPALDHGSRSTYVYYRCSCPKCRSANAKYKRDKVRSNIHAAASSAATFKQAGYDTPIPWLTHGIPSTYEWWGCRCKECREAVDRRRKERRLKAS